MFFPVHVFVTEVESSSKSHFGLRHVVRPRAGEGKAHRETPRGYDQWAFVDEPEELEEPEEEKTERETAVPMLGVTLSVCLVSHLAGIGDL